LLSAALPWLSAALLPLSAAIPWPSAALLPSTAHRNNFIFLCACPKVNITDTKIDIGATMIKKQLLGENNI
jgi:hypothetical protein